MDSFQDLREKYMYHSQKQAERAKKAKRTSSLAEIAQRSNVKLVALQKALKTKMDEKKREKYEKRVMMYKIANEEEEAEYEKFFDENESESEFNADDKKEKQQEDDEEMEDEDEKATGSQGESSKDEKDKIATSSQEESNDKDSQEQHSDLEDECSNHSSQESMDYTQTNLMEDNRDLVTKMLYRTQQSQLDNEGILGLCSAKVPSNDFIDDECEEDDDGVPDRRFDSEDDDEENDDDKSFLNDNEESENEEEMSQLNELQKDNDKLGSEESNQESAKEVDLLKASLNKHRKDLESDSDEEELSFVNKFKFNKVCKIQESDDEEANSGFDSNRAKSTANEEDDECSNQNDVYDNLNSQDSQFVSNNRESTFLESRSDHRKPRLNLKEFIDDQAELSEEDKGKFSSDEEEDSNDEYEQEEIDENLPSEEEILKANNKMFLKQQMDEDRREILEYQERFLEFGDLHDDGEARQRKFKWKNVTNVWVDNVKDSSDSDEFDIDDSQIEYTTLHLKQLSEMDKSKAVAEGSSQDASQNATQSSASLSFEEKRKKKLMNTSLNKTHLSSYSTFDNSIFNKHMRTFKRSINGPANDIQSYIIKDKNLVNAMSVKSSVVAANNQPKGRQQSARSDFGMVSNAKKRKVEKNENKKSIFDLF